MTSPTPPPRRRTTRRSVYLVDGIASVAIKLGGLIVVAAVLGIGVYLVAVTFELFRSGMVEREFEASIRADESTLLLMPDEHGSSLIRLLANGLMQTLVLDTGEVVDERLIVPEGRTITAFSSAPRGGHVAIGYDDGSVQLGSIGFRTEFLAPDQEPESLRELEIGRMCAYEGAVAARTPLDQLRLTTSFAEFADPVSLRAGDGAVILIDYHVDNRNEYVAALRQDGSAVFNEVRKIESLMGGATRIRLNSHELPAHFDVENNPPHWLFVTGDGGSVLFVWEDGGAQRYDASDPSAIRLAESVRVVDEGRHVTAAAKMLGGATFAIGDDGGNVYGYFASRNAFADTSDSLALIRGHTLTPQDGAITTINVSTRDRTFITGDDRGGAVVRNMTSHAEVASITIDEPVAHALLKPKVDGVLLVDRQGRMQVFALDPRHPEATWNSLFGKVWYEGDPEPSYTYQSSSGDDAAEAKYNLVPLIFGTLKATIYTMLISIPFGILAAIYTSEFLSPRLRAAIKPSIEMMASLPSVVLGFIAAMVLAPLVRDLLPGILLAFVGIPIGVLLGAYLWHFAPVRYMSRVSAGGRLVMIIVVTTASMLGSIALGPVMESLLFQPSPDDVLVRAGSYEPAPRDSWPDWMSSRSSVSDADARRLRQDGLYYRGGVIVRPAGDLNEPELSRRIELQGFDQPDIRAWLDGVIGGPWPGWFMLSFPAAAIIMSIVVVRVVDPKIRRWDREQSPFAEAVMELVKFFLVIASCALLAALAATILTAAGLDARNSIFGSFQQRNTLVVGIAMAVAVIPIIYTIADDAMTSVPDSLRSASLGAGATRWQTAIRVVMPVAMSGVFSACMIGLGRAAGETMIVLMATGNTPIMSWSVFDGLRTLSANIAVELPEAPKDSTHYRVLFLCGLVLFAITFIVNTGAEVIRQRVRKRSASL